VSPRVASHRIARQRRLVRSPAACPTKSKHQDETTDQAARSAERSFKYHVSLTAHAAGVTAGMALAIYPIGVQRGFITHKEAVARTLTTLRFFWQSPHGTAADATGYRGFYYHFLDMRTGKRVWNCELSPVDTTFLLARALTAALYFDHDSEDEHEIRSLPDALYQRADCQWAQNGGATVTVGWKPESGFLPFHWEGYDEALPTHPLPAESYKAWASTYEWKEIYGFELLHAGPLFTHQLSHVWIDFRGLALIPGPGQEV
jgi:hypothetical protein